MTLRTLAAWALLVWQASALGQAVLHSAEQAWVAQAPALRFAPEHDYGPFVFADAQGRVQGLSVELLQEVLRLTGLRMEVLPAKPLSEYLAAARRHEVDVISSLRATPERGEYLAFTRPYVSVPAVLAVAQRGGAASLASLQGKVVAVGKGYAVEAAMRSRHPAVVWEAVSDDAVALRGLAQGKYAGAVLDAASLAFVVRQHGLKGIFAAEQVGFEYALSFAVRNDWPLLREVLDKGIQAMGPAYHEEVLSRWLAMPDEAVAPRAPAATRAALALLAVAAAVALWHWVRQRRKPL